MKFKETEFWIEIDSKDAWRAEAELRIKKIPFKEKDNVFYFENSKDENRAFKLFNKMELIIY